MGESMPIINGTHSRVDTILFGLKDLIIQFRAKLLLDTNSDEVKYVKTLTIYTNNNGRQMDPNNTDLTNKSDPYIDISFFDDDSIQKLINELTELKNDEIITQ